MIEVGISTTTHGGRGAANLMASLLLATTTLAAGAMIGTPALAQEARSYDIPAGPLPDVLNAYARQAGVELAYRAELTANASSAGLKGSFGLAEGLSRILVGSGITYRQTGARAFTLEPAPAADAGTVQLGPVRVGGSSGNGGGSFASKDLGQTEETNSYTTHAVTIGKSALSLRETPQSVSVVTRQRLDDQNLVDLSAALKTVTGVTVQRNGGDGTFNTYQARGYEADGLQRDGVNTYDSSGSNAQLDVAIFDRIEVMRGAAGLLKGVGNPGVTINLVRKRALDSLQIKGVAALGTYDTYRAEADVTGPLNSSGAIRGRAVAVLDDRGSYLNNIENRKLVGYGTLEFDLGTSTTFSIGGTWQEIEGTFFRGLPAYAGGRLLDVSRKTTLATDWTDSRFRNAEVFGEIEHRFDNGGRLKASLRRQSVRNNFGFLYSPTGIDASGVAPSLSAERQDWRLTNTSLDVFLDTPFSLGGREHNLLIGVDHSKYSQLFVDYETPSLLPGVNLFNVDLRNRPEPRYEQTLVFKQERKSTGVYGQLRINPLDALTIIGGARLSWHEAANTVGVRTFPQGKASGRLTPYAAAILDLSKSISVYASYAEIFQPTNASTADGKILAPRIGGQWEAGLKAEALDGALNASFAIYRVLDRNRPLTDPDAPDFSIAAGKVRAQGFEAEISGKITDAWSVTAGYAYTDTEYLRDEVSSNGQIFSNSTPKHNISIWIVYRLPIGERSGLDLGGGIRAVSDSFSERDGTRYPVKSYAILSAQVGYSFNENMRVSVNIENLLDKTYYERTNGRSLANYFGEPRTVMLSLRGKY